MPADRIRSAPEHIEALYNEMPMASTPRLSDFAKPIALVRARDREIVEAACDEACSEMSPHVGGDIRIPHSDECCRIRTALAHLLSEAQEEKHDG